MGRLVRSASRLVTLAALGGTFTVNPNLQRIAIMFATDPGTAGADNIALQANGVVVGGLGNFLFNVYFNLLMHGDLPTKQWVLTNASADTPSVGIVEFFLPEDVLTEGLEQLKREYPGVWKR